MPLKAAGVMRKVEQTNDYIKAVKPLRSLEYFQLDFRFERLTIVPTGTFDTMFQSEH